jgi:hypothetical protein
MTGSMMGRLVLADLYLVRWLTGAAVAVGAGLYARSRRTDFV